MSQVEALQLQDSCHLAQPYAFLHVAYNSAQMGRSRNLQGLNPIYVEFVPS